MLIALLSLLSGWRGWCEDVNLALATGAITKVPGGPEAKNYHPAWSPDSKRIAYSSTTFRNGHYYSLIRVSGIRGENDRTWAISDCYATPVSWSTDGRRVAYLSGCLPGGSAKEIWVIDLAKPVPLLAKSRADIYSFAWT